MFPQQALAFSESLGRVARPGSQGSYHSAQFSSPRAEAPVPLGLGPWSHSLRKNKVLKTLGIFTKTVSA